MDPLRIIFQDEALLVLDKPSGLLVHRGWGRDRVTLLDQVLIYLGAETVHPIHRLDRATSGVILFALDPESARTLNDSFDAKRVSKRYLALVRGRAPEGGLIDHPIQRRENGPRVPAQTAFRTLHAVASEPRHTSLVEAAPLTGRAHQVRRHLKHINCPLIGDTNYGESKLNHAFADNYGLKRLALHSLSLRLQHPITGADLNFTAEPPPDLAEPLVAMGFPKTAWTTAPFEGLDWLSTVGLDNPST
jgi:tRNA pseudouridine65 synthase